MKKKDLKYLNIAQTADKPKKLFKLFFKTTNTDVRLPVIRRLGEMKEKPEAQKLLTELAEGKSHSGMSPNFFQRAEAALYLSDADKKRDILYGIRSRLNPLEPYCWDEWLGIIKDEDTFKRFAKEGDIRKDTKKLRRLVNTAPDRSCIVFAISQTLDPEAARKAGELMVLTPKEWFAVAENTGCEPVRDEAIRHTDKSVLHQLQKWNYKESVQKHLVTLAPEQYPQYLKLLTDDNALAQIAGKLSPDGLMIACKNTDNIDRFYIFFNRLKDHPEQLGQLLESCRSPKQADVIIETLKSRPDIIADALSKSTNSHLFNDPLRYISDDGQLYKIACGSGSYVTAKEAARRLPPSYTAKLSETACHVEVKHYAIKLSASSREEAEAIKELLSTAYKTDSNLQSGLIIGLKDKELRLFSALSPEKSVEIFLMYPQVFGRESVIAEMRKKLHGKKPEASFITKLSEAMYSSDVKWSTAPNSPSRSCISIATGILAEYEGVKYGEAAWNHGGEKYICHLQSKLKSEKSYDAAKTCVDEMKAIYRDSEESRKVLNNLSGTSYRKHTDLVFACYSNNQSYYTLLIVSF